MQKLTIIAALALAACTATKDDSGDTAAETTDTGSDDTGTPAMTATAELTATGVTVTITNGTGSYDFGIVQSGTSDNWTGEDCFRGYALSGGVSLNCHSVSATGGTLTAVAGSDYDFGTPDPNETLFKAGIDGDVTYYLENEAGQCYVWGANAAYYAEKGCTEL